MLDDTAEQSRRIDELALAEGRDPASIRRSYTIFGSWDPRQGDVTYEDVFDGFGAVGISDFVLDWPDDPDIAEFERVAREVIPAARRG